MAISSFGRGRDAEGDTNTSAPASKSSSSSGGLTAFIDQGSEFEGKLSFRDTVRIDGKFRGEITSENSLIVGESGEIDAEIHSKTVSISGTVHGNVIAQQKVVLHKTAHVHGDIEAPTLVVEEGAKVSGKITMPGSAGKGAANLKAVPVDSDSKKSGESKGSDA
ncbi:MAG: polymer-forming cytoskeletal protein [Myxococcales bacterium]|nr:polymer-forming cytoskeletal protein [Myxococcales bacterium]